MSKRPSAWFYLLVFLLPVGGCLVTATSFIKGTGGIADMVAGMHRVVVPGEANVDLDAGKYTVFYEHHSVVDGATYATGNLNGLRCSVHDQDGAEVTLTAPSASMTYSFGNHAGSAIWTLEAARTGTYVLSCHFDSDEGGKVVLAFLSGSFTGELLKTILPAVLGMLFGFGAFLTIFILRRR